MAPTPENSPQAALVIGAGAAGSSCASILRRAGHQVRLVDKGRRPGGRMATRRLADGATGRHFEFDHGAPWFSIRSPTLSQTVDEWTHWGDVAAWHARCRYAGRIGDAEAGLVGLPTMTAVASALAYGPVEQSIAVKDLLRTDDGWSAWTSEGVSLGTFRAVVVAIPGPQAVPLLANAGRLGAEAQQAEMSPIWTMMVSLRVRPQVDFEMWKEPSSVVDLLVDNDSKPGRGGGADSSNWVVHANSQWSQRNLERCPNEVKMLLWEELSRLLPGLRSEDTLHCSTHRWRYARVLRAVGDSGFLWDPEQSLGACGDWCIGAGVEAALLSGRRLGRAILRDGTLGY